MTHSHPSSSPIDAYEALQPYIRRTPLLTSHLLNKWLGAEIYFKAEGFQRTGSFKARGALYSMLQAQKKASLQGDLKPIKVVLFSSGNHAQSCAWAGSKLAIDIAVYMPKSTSAIKVQATRSYGARVHLTEDRAEAEQRCKDAMEKGALRIPPSDHDDVIAGAGTIAIECFQELPEIEAIFSPCGGGGLLSGCFLAREALERDCKIFGCEPMQACDASESYRLGQIMKFAQQPSTLAEGARTPAVSKRTFAYLRQLDGFFLASEQELSYWCQWLLHLLKTPVEPTAALAMVGAWKYLRENREAKGPLVVILTGANLSAETMHEIWSECHLDTLPSRQLRLDERLIEPLLELTPAHPL